MNQILLLPLNVLSINHLLLPLNVFQISRLLLPLNTFPISQPADQEPATVVTRHISDQSSKSTTPPTVTLPKNTKKWKQSLMIKDKTKKKKVNAPSNENNTNQKRGSVPQGEDKTKKKKTNTTEE